MRILHVHNVAGVSSLLAKYMDHQFGSQSLVITRRVLDRYGLTDYGVALDCGANEFALRCLIKARRFDIIHVHDFDKIIPYLKFFYRTKPIVLEYHSYRFEDRWDERRKFWEKADRVLVSTPNLLANAPKDVRLLSNPVDVARFVSTGKRAIGTAAYFVKHPRDEEFRELAEKAAATSGLTLTVYEVRQKAIPYSEMPAVLGKHEYLIDQQYYTALSKTALEALALGCKVIRWDGLVVHELPAEHKPQKVVTELYSIYTGLLDSKLRTPALEATTSE